MGKRRLECRLPAAGWSIARECPVWRMNGQRIHHSCGCVMGMSGEIVMGMLRDEMMLLP